MPHQMADLSVGYAQRRLPVKRQLRTSMWWSDIQNQASTLCAFCPLVRLRLSSQVSVDHARCYWYCSQGFGRSARPPGICIYSSVELEKTFQQSSPQEGLTGGSRGKPARHFSIFSTQRIMLVLRSENLAWGWVWRRAMEGLWPNKWAVIRKYSRQLQSGK